MSIHFTQSEFRKFVSDNGEYSCTLPSGTTVGKRWARRTPYRHPMVMGHPTECAGRWYVGEYYDIHTPGQIGIRWHKVVLRDDNTMIRGRVGTYK